MILPVQVYHQDNPEQQRVIYALLNPVSNGTFIQLQVNGIETQLKLNTMHGSEVVLAQRVSGLIIERMNGEVHIELSKVYLRNKIPSKRKEISRPKSTAKWPRSLKRSSLQKQSRKCLSEISMK